MKTSDYYINVENKLGEYTEYPMRRQPKL